MLFLAHLVLPSLLEVVHSVIHISAHPIVNDEVILGQSSAHNRLILLLRYLVIKFNVFQEHLYEKGRSKRDAEQQQLISMFRELFQQMIRQQESAFRDAQRRRQELIKAALVSRLILRCLRLANLAEVAEAAKWHLHVVTKWRIH